MLDSRFQILYSIIFALLFGVGFAMMAPLLVQAAEIQIDSKSEDIKTGDQFKVVISIDTAGEYINAIEGRLVFPENLVELKEIQDGGTIVNFWIERPQIGNNEDSKSVSFSGITPGGYIGEKGLIFSALFQAKTEGGGRIEIHDIMALLNDGKGSKAQTQVSNFQFSISEPVSDSRFQIPDSRIEDTEPPESFKPEVASSPSIFGGKYFLVFATQDKGSGISHYEVVEFRSQNLEFRKLLNKALQFIPNSKFQILDSYKTAKSPYVLRDQKLSSYIYVKAVDKSGNERIITLTPLNHVFGYIDYLILVMLLAVMVATAHLIRKFLWKIKR